MMLSFAGRTIASILTVVYLVTSAVACPVQPAQDIPSFSAKSGIPLGSSSPALSLLQPMEEVAREMQTVVEQYAKSHPDAPDIHIQTIPVKEDYIAALHSRLLAGEAVDLFFLPDLTTAYRIEEYLEYFSELEWAEDSVIEPMRINQKTVGLPFSIEGMGIIANRDILEAADITWSDINSFERLSEALVQLREMIDSGELSEKFPRLEAITTIPAGDDGYVTQFLADILLAGAFDSPERAYAATTLDLSQNSGAEGFVSLLARNTIHRSTWHGLNNTSAYDLAEDGLATGRIALAFTSTEIYRRIYPAAPELEGRLVLLPLCFEDWERGAVLISSPAFWAINANSSDHIKSAATNLIKWLYNSEEGSHIFAESFNAVSPYVETGTDTGFVLHRQLLSYVESGQTMPSLIAAAPKGWGEEVFLPELREYFSVRDKTWNELADRCQQGWNARRQNR